MYNIITTTWLVSFSQLDFDKSSFIRYSLKLNYHKKNITIIVSKMTSILLTDGLETYINFCHSLSFL